MSGGREIGMEVRGHTHFVGVAGVGMSAVAQLLKALGADVSGSDRYLDRGENVDVLNCLRRAGIRLVPQDGSGVHRGTRAVVVSTAIEQDNPDLQAAASAGVPVVHRAEMLARLGAGAQCIAVTGTSGKSTVTGMVGWILEQAGWDPTVVNGAAVLGWEKADAVGNVRVGRSPWWVLEVDESDRSLMRFHPEHAVITNASVDHFDMAETTDLFRRFMAQVRGKVVGRFVDPSLVKGFAPEAASDGTRFLFRGVRFHVRLPGRHNAENALHAAALCEVLGVPVETAARALATFRGIRRRLERVAVCRGVEIIDDYGHNPAKIRASWEAMVPGHRRLLGIWRPHGYRPLVTMLDPLEAMFREVLRPEDRLWVLPVYDAGGTADRNIHSGMLVDRLVAAGLPAEGIQGPAVLLDRVAAAVGVGDVVLVMGARDPGLPALARAVAAAIEARPGR